MARKKSEGIEALVSKPEPVSIQEITMLDWYAGFAMMRTFGHPSHAQTAEEIFSLAESMMAEREKRI